MERQTASTSSELLEIHDLYQRKLAAALAGFKHIDLTIPAQAQVADQVMEDLSSDLSSLAEASAP